MLTNLAQGITELYSLIPPPEPTGDIKTDNQNHIRAILAELRVDDISIRRQPHKGCWICDEFTRLGAETLLNEADEELASSSRDRQPTRGRRPSRSPRRRNAAKPFLKLTQNVRGFRQTLARVVLTPRSRRELSSTRRAPTKKSKAGGDPKHIVQRIPDIILDTRLNDTGNRSTHRCDECERVFHGPYQGCHLPGIRELTYQQMAEGWKNGEVDATWYCVDCWAAKNALSHDDTREMLSLPPKATPPTIDDNRFCPHTDRWSICDSCQCHCTGRARDWLPGSFVFRKDNTMAGPPHPRQACFPRQGEREDHWRREGWNATFLCRECLVVQWGKTPEEITEWLKLSHSGGATAAAIRNHQQARRHPEKGRGKGRREQPREQRPIGEWRGHRGW